jgi:very-short-patch-repair endonuclease
MPDAIWINRDIRGEPRSDALDARVAQLAESQHGVIARRQLTDLGLGPDAIDRRLRAKRLLPLHRAVYAVGHRSRSNESAWMAAVLAGGEGAVLSHRSGAAHWRIRPAGGGSRVEVTTPRGQHPRHGIRFHRCRLPPDEITVKHGVPVTTVPRTLFDLGAVLDQRQLERAVNEAEVLRLWDELSLHDLLRRYPRRPGTRVVRAVLQARRAGSSFTRSDLEELFLRFADKHGLPRPETNIAVEGCEVDCLWRELRLIIEVDGWETHRTRAAFERDREKSRILQAAGWRCVAVTYRQLLERPGEVARDVRRLLRVSTLAA